MILRDELELERSLIVPGHSFEHRLVGVRDDDGPKQSGACSLIQRPVEDWFQADRKYLFREPACDRQESCAQPTARYHCRIERHDVMLGKK